MPMFRKKPITIEAVQWSGDLSDLAIIQALSPHGVGEDVRIGPCPSRADEATHDLWVETLEGVMHAKPGDYIIKGIKGEVYPCKPDIFEVTYESVPPSSPEPTCKTCGDCGFYSVPTLYQCDHGATPPTSVE